MSRPTECINCGATRHKVNEAGLCPDCAELYGVPDPTTPNQANHTTHAFTPCIVCTSTAHSLDTMKLCPLCASLHHCN